MVTREQIIDAYIDYLREHGEPPATVARFCKEAQIEERVFFTEFASFDAVETAFWRGMLDRVVHAVEQGEAWSGFGARQRYLAFLYAWVEESLGHRSLLLARIGKVGPLARPPYLRGLESRFKEFAEAVLNHGIATDEIADRGKLAKLYPEALYVHFRGVIDFNLKDESEKYERTDAFIEKTVAVAFDLIRTQAVDSAFDLVRFLFQSASPRG